MKKYPNLQALLQDDPNARSYFMNLPDYVQATIRERADNINSFDSMTTYAEKLTRGDD